MNTDEFWQMVDAARDPGGDTFETAENLREALEKLPLADVNSFMAVQGQILEQSYQHKLWGAAYLVHGGCTDDQFEAFRGWLLAQGRSTFERVVADPDLLADVLTSGERAESEQMLYVGALAHEALAGDFPEGPVTQLPELRATFAFSDRAALESNYPKLWVLFANAPLVEAAPAED